MAEDVIPPDWQPPRWIEPFTKRELQWLAARLDASNRELRIVNRRLVTHIERHQEKQP